MTVGQLWLQLPTLKAVLKHLFHFQQLHIFMPGILVLMTRTEPVSFTIFGITVQEHKLVELLFSMFIC